MSLNIKRRVAFGVTALAVTAFAGGAFAATQESGANGRQAFLGDVAKRLNVTPQQLTAAMNSAALDQLKAAVAAGRLTQAQANAIKQRIQQNGGAPLGPFLFGPGAPNAPKAQKGPNGPGFFHGPRFFGGGPGGGAGPLGAAAKYLGLSDTQLFKDLASGKSLAQIAKSQGKSASGLKDALVSATKAKLDKAVAAKLMTGAQEQQILSRLSAGLDARINQAGFGPSFGPRGAFRGPGPATPGAPRAFRYGSGPAASPQAAAGPIA